MKVFKLTALSSLFFLTACGGGGSSTPTMPTPVPTPPPVPSPVPSPDTTPPVITIKGNSTVNLNLNTAFQEPGVTANDTRDGSVPVEISGEVNSAQLGKYILTYRAKDSSGNEASVTREVNVTGFRDTNTLCVPTAPTNSQPGEVAIVKAFPNLPKLNSPLALVQPINKSDFWLVALREGKIVSFENKPTVAKVSAVLDISAKVSTEFEMGFTGLTIHPNYPNDNRIFAVYNDNTQSGRSTISSFKINPTTLTIESDSENVLLTLPQPAMNHNGGDIAFGPDGYLYVAFGDGGNERSQSQNLSNLLGAMIRLDVSGTGYTIPADNPFNSGQAKCSNGSSASSAQCPEIFAYGFRNPWRWSFDKLTGDLWVADVGESTFEEVNKVVISGNYGWPIMEGDQCFEGQSCSKSNLKLPITQYPRSIGISTVGGYVYRGSDSPSLAGQYLWGDTLSSQFLSIPANSSVGTNFKKIFNSQKTIAGMAQDNDGEVYLLNLQGDKGDGIYKIAASGGTTNASMPTKLSEVGCFDTVNKRSSQGVFDYQINSVLWSDGADKTRSFAIPDNEKIKISDDGDFEFPTNSILIKHFLNNTNYLETRLLVNHSSGWQGYSYEWNEQQTDAVLLDGAKTKDVGNFVHSYPSKSQCTICHTSAAKLSLGIETSQLNLTHTELKNNQLDFLSSGDFLSQALVSSVQPKLFALDDTTATAEQRARSYLHSNCSGCHRPGTAGSFIDLRFDTKLAQTNTCDVAPTLGEMGAVDAKRIAPGRAKDSVLLLRMQTLDSNRMPPLASLLVDQPAVNIVEEWIDSLVDCK